MRTNKFVLTIGFFTLFALAACVQAAPPEPTATLAPTKTLTLAFTESPELTLTPTPFDAIVDEDRSSCVVSAPPAGYGEWFQKYCNAGGVPILASQYVSDISVQQAYYVVTNFFAPIPDRKQAFIDTGGRFVIYDFDHETILDIPSTRLFDFVNEGGGVFISENSLTISYENDLLCADGLKSNYAIHELAHAIDFTSLQASQEWEKARNFAFGTAKNQSLWGGAYAMTNKTEYWAEGATAYFNVYWDPASANERVDREELATYDPILFELLDQTFHGFEWTPTCP